MVDETVILGQLLSASVDVVFVKDLAGHYLAANEACLQLVGKSPDEMIGKVDAEIYPPEQAEYFAATDVDVLESGVPYQATGQPMLVGGEERFFDIVKMPMRDPDGEIVGLIGVGRDITRLHLIESQLLDQNRYLEAFNALVIDATRNPTSDDGFGELVRYSKDMVDVDWVLLRTSAAVERVGDGGELADELVDVVMRSGRPCSWTAEGGSAPAIVRGHVGPGASAIALPIHSGEEICGAVAFGLVRGEFDPTGLQHASEVASHVSLAVSQRQFLIEVAHRARHDGLTGLANRSVFDTMLEQSVAEADRYGREFGIVFIDLDGFKPINDRFGHAAGDQVLITVGQRLKGRLRLSDTVARVGGDEFAAILRELPDRSALASVAAQLAALCGEPLWIDGVEVQVGASIGVAWYPSDAPSASELLAVADQRMYDQKRHGR